MPHSGTQQVRKGIQVDAIIERLEDTMEALCEALEAAQTASEVLGEAKAALEHAEADLTLSGLSGKNAEARRAELFALTDNYRADVTAAERQHTRARTELAVAEVRHRTAREIARLKGRES